MESKMLKIIFNMFFGFSVGKLATLAFIVCLFCHGVVGTISLAVLMLCALYEAAIHADA